MQKSEEAVVSEFAGVRSGKASPALVENINIEAYEGSSMRLKELAVERDTAARKAGQVEKDRAELERQAAGLQAALDEAERSLGLALRQRVAEAEVLLGRRESGQAAGSAAKEGGGQQEEAAATAFAPEERRVHCRHVRHRFETFVDPISR